MSYTQVLISLKLQKVDLSGFAKKLLMLLSIKSSQSSDTQKDWQRLLQAKKLYFNGQCKTQFEGKKA